MPINESQRNAVHNLAEIERTISRLYRLFAEKFPGCKQFWTKLANDENEHANWVVMLKGQVEIGSAVMDQQRFKIDMTMTSLDYVEQKLKQAERPNMDLAQAFRIALDIEQLLIESEYYRAYDTDKEDLKQILDDLQKANERHRRLLTEFKKDHP